MKKHTFLEVGHSENSRLQYVWIPGWGGTAYGLLPLIESLGFGTHRILEPLGANGELKNRQNLSMEEMAEYALKLCEGLEDFSLMGISMGGIIAQLMAPRLNLLELHLMCTTRGGLNNPEPIAPRARQIWFSRAGVEEDPVLKMLGPCFSEKSQSVKLAYAGHLRKQPYSLSGHALKLHFQAMLACDTSPALTMLSCPVYAHEGQEDQVVLPFQRARIEEVIALGDVFSYPGGHLFFLEKPELLGTRLLALRGIHGG